MKEAIGELVPLQVLKNSIMFSYSPNIQPLLLQFTKFHTKDSRDFPAFEARSGQEPLVKKFKVLGSHEWAHMDFNRISKKFVRIFHKALNCVRTYYFFRFV